MHKLKLLSLALTLPLLALMNVKPASAACVISLTINGIPHQACRGFEEHQDALASLDIPGFSYDKDSHTITLNGFNGTIVGENRGSSTETSIQNILPVIVIAGDSVINNVTFKAGTITTPTTNTTETTQTATEAGPSTDCVFSTSTDCEPSSILSNNIFVFLVIGVLVTILIVSVILLITKKFKAKKSPTPPSAPETPNPDNI